MIYHYDKETGKVVEGPPPQRRKYGEAFQIMPMFQEYETVGCDKRIIKSRQEHKAFLKEHNAEEVGNEMPKWMAEKKRKQREEGKEG